MTYRFCTAATLVLLFACPAHGAPFLAIGRNAELLLTGVATIRYDDNIFLTDSGRRQDLVYSITPGVKYGYDGALTRISAAVSNEFLRYGDNSVLDASLASGRFVIDREGVDSRLAVHAGYAEYGQGALNALSRSQIARRNRTSASVSGEIGIGGRTRVGGGAAYNRANYPGTKLIGSRSIQFPCDIYYALSARLDLSAGYRYRVNRFADGLRDSKDNGLNIGARGEFTPKLNGRIRVGWTGRSFVSGGGGSLLGFDADLEWLHSPKTTCRLTVSNDFGNSAAGVSESEFAVSLNGRFEFDDAWSVSAMFGCSTEDYETGRSDRFLVGDFSVTCRLQENVSLQGTWIVRTNDSNVPSLDFTNNILSFATSVRY